MREIRKKRINNLIKEKISILLLNGEINDPRIDSFVTITNVSITKDFKFARVYVSCYGNENKRKSYVKALNHAAGHIQRLLGNSLRIKFVPHLNFVIDNSIEYGYNIIRKIEDL
jgi:ribosome-binding factor A